MTRSTGTSNISRPMPAESVVWPPLRPLLPIDDLGLETVLEGQIVTVPQFFTSSLCKKYVSFLSALPLVTTPGRPKKGEAVRVNDRFQIDDSAFAERLWNETSLKELVAGPPKGEQSNLWGGEVIGLNPNIRIYRYSKGQYFDQHYDDSNTVQLANPSRRAKTTWTLLIYLTSPATGCIGGETVFYPEPVGTKKKKGASKASQPEPIIINLQAGMALLHKHGADCLLHEGREVQQGEKWVIRSDLLVT